MSCVFVYSNTHVAAYSCYFNKTLDCLPCVKAETLHAAFCAYPEI